MKAKGEIVSKGLESFVDLYPDLDLSVRSKGLFWGLDFGKTNLAGELSKRSFANGLVLETAGSRDQVLKVMPPLTIDMESLKAGLDIIALSLHDLVYSESRVEILAAV